MFYFFLGCYHNGSMYADGSLVPTMEPCLNCKCTKTNLICSLRVCSEQPIPPPRGCVLVKKKDVCCSYVTCNNMHLYGKMESANKKTYLYQDNEASSEVQYQNAVQQRVLTQNVLYRRLDNSEEQVEGNEQCKNNHF